ncbi:hypothetical protein BC938DRAFT_472933 [Jimgerdemannia flammicorona]|uniref:Uncharacterized protein n=1 Tax=Jimgerdemannia flammicorona TaxID=994334 RepID=A0A433Q548_9FUNG|nr:hypothetical protein BC938DRAFT_472933 [Jimgerdemannia flammicorona]
MSSSSGIGLRITPSPYLDVQIWGMDLPIKRVYRMFLLGTFQFPIRWEEHDQLLRGLPVLWALAKSPAIPSAGGKI